MRKSVLVASILAAAIGCASLAPAIAQRAPAHGSRGEHGMTMDGHAYAKLDLSDAQRTQIKQLAQQGFAQTKPQMQALRQARQTYESATPGTAAYQSATTALAQAEADAASARVTQRAALRSQIYQVLSPAQRSQLARIHDQREARMQQWKQFQQENPLPQSSSSATPSTQ